MDSFKSQHFPPTKLPALYLWVVLQCCKDFRFRVQGKLGWPKAGGCWQACSVFLTLKGGHDLARADKGGCSRGDATFPFVVGLGCKCVGHTPSPKMAKEHQREGEGGVTFSLRRVKGGCGKGGRGGQRGIKGPAGL